MAVNRRHYDWLLIGATAYACALAAHLRRQGARVAVSETTCLVGYEFSEGAFGGPYRRERYGAPGQALYDCLADCGALDAHTGALCFPAIAPILCRRLRDSGADCYFLTRISALRQTEAGYEADLFSLGGVTPIDATHILDTTADLQSGGWFGVRMPDVPYRIGIQLTAPASPCAWPVFPDP